jgi:DNA repair exonuclease SbcCD ATPase subunit
LREALFCHACVQTQFQRVNERATLRDKIDDFAKQELAAKEVEIEKLKRELKKTKHKMAQAQSLQEDLQEKLLKAEQKNMVLVPSDPHYMLGLQPGQAALVESRAKMLMKVLHPDKSGSSETAYLFDMVLKARDMITKS